MSHRYKNNKNKIKHIPKWKLKLQHEEEKILGLLARNDSPLLQQQLQRVRKSLYGEEEVGDK